MQRRDFELLIVAMVAGPPLGACILFILAAFIRLGPLGITQIDFALIFATLPFAYLLAAPPMLAIGVANAVAARFARTDGLQMLLALPIGALSFGFGLAELATTEAAASPASIPPVAVPLTGALVSLLCVALVGAFGTPLRYRS